VDPEKASKILSNAAYGGNFTFDQDFRDALKTGLRALRLIHRGITKGLSPQELRLLLGAEEKPNE